MGLDSVELLVSFENYFNVSISDREAESIRTVQEMVDCTAKHLNILNNDEEIKIKIFEKLKSIFIQHNIVNNDLLIKDKIFDYLNPDDQNFWNALSNKLELKIPYPYRENGGVIKRVLSFVTSRPDYDWKEITIDEFITALAANNYELLIKPNEIKSKYEILIAIIAIITDKIDVDIYEVQPHKRFVDDFGID
jgi:acyl carrier protein